eukprot:3780879-Pleurochrysis_carterae.AAC.2
MAERVKAQPEPRLRRFGLAERAALAVKSIAGCRLRGKSDCVGVGCAGSSAVLLALSALLSSPWGADGSGAEGVPTSMCAAGDYRFLAVVDWTGRGRSEVVLRRWTAAMRATMALAMIKLRSGG